MTPRHAVETFTKTRMDVLVLGNHVVRRANEQLDSARDDSVVAASPDGG